MSKGCQKGEMDILDREGILKTAIRYETISLDAGRYVFGGLAYFLKIPKILEIIYFAAWLCEGEPTRYGMTCSTNQTTQRIA